MVCLPPWPGNIPQILLSSGARKSETSSLAMTMDDRDVLLQCVDTSPLHVLPRCVSIFGSQQSRAVVSGDSARLGLLSRRRTSSRGMWNMARRGV